MVRHDGLLFGSGWYERGPNKTDAPAYTKSFVEQALNLYDALGLDAAIEYYGSEGKRGTASGTSSSSMRTATPLHIQIPCSSAATPASA